MGYITYTVGTLIAAVVIHSLWTRKQNERYKTTTNGQTVGSPQISISEPEYKIDQDHIQLTAVSIEISHDEDDGTVSRTQAPSPTSTSSTDSDIGEEQNVVDQQSAMKYVASQHQSPQMAPPPRPSSAPNLQSLATQARQTAAMPPPSSLPPSRNRSPPRLKPATASSLAPPPRQGGFASPTGLRNSNLLGSTLAPPTSAAASLRVPQRVVLSNTHMQPSLSTSTQAPTKRSSRQVMLTPGHSPLDWAALTKSATDSSVTTLRGNDATDSLGLYRMGRITPSMLKKQNGRKGKDAWTVYQGRVYNITAYLDFHPGGTDELLKGAGRTSDKLFSEVHPWVNWEGMLSGCLVGMLVAEDDEQVLSRTSQEERVNENGLDEMD